MSDVVLRLKCRAGTFPLTVPLNGAVTDLREQASALSEIPVASIRLLMGFPPRPLPSYDGSVADAGLKSGDTLIAELDSTSAGHKQARAEAESEILKHVTGQETSNEVPLILRKVVPADNSCLFTSMGFVLGGK